MRASAELLGQFPESRHVFLRDGRFYEAGELFQQPALAATLKRLQRQGPREFYEGKTAQLIADEMASHGGLVTRTDLVSYHAVERPPLRGSYRGYEIVTMPPAELGWGGSTGNARDVGVPRCRLARAQLRGEDPPVRGGDARAFRDRAELLGDPDFVSIPVDALLDRGRLAREMTDFDPARATPNDALPTVRCVHGARIVRDDTTLDDRCRGQRGPALLIRSTGSGATA